MSRRITFSATLTLIAAASLAACGSNSGSTTASSTANTASSAATTTSTTATDTSSSDSTTSSTGSSATSATAGTYTLAQVKTHNTASSCWVAIQPPGSTSTNVYDLTKWINQHPGGATPIKSLCGTNGTQAFINKHGDDGAQGKPEQALAQFKLGVLQG